MGNELITKAEDLHLSWYIQVQYQMCVLGIATTYIAVLCKGCHLRYFKVPYNAAIAEDAIAKGLEFWEKYIKTGTAPEDVGFCIYACNIVRNACLSLSSMTSSASKKKPMSSYFALLGNFISSTSGSEESGRLYYIAALSSQHHHGTIQCRQTGYFLRVSPMFLFQTKRSRAQRRTASPH